MKQKQKKMIGVIGGMGPYAGLDLVKKIFDLTEANQDQKYLPLTMISLPHKIIDRTQFLEGQIKENPGIEISKIMKKLFNQGALVIGMPCNTAHSPKILKEIIKTIPKSVMFINMIKEVVKFILDKYPGAERVGILGTIGTINSNVYSNELLKNKLESITLNPDSQKELLDESIYNKDYGIKSFSNPVKKIVIRNIDLAIKLLIKKKADVIILGCTELPLAINYQSYRSIPLIDSTLVLARSLILHADRNSLKKDFR